MQLDTSPFGVRPRRRWRWLSWKVSLAALALPLLGVLVTAGYHVVVPDDRVRLTVVDAYSGEPLPGVTVVVGEVRAQTDGQGEVTLSVPEPTTARIEQQDYDQVRVTLSPDTPEVRVSLRPNVVRGSVTSSTTGEPIAGVVVEARRGEEVLARTTTDSAGAYELRDVPEDVSLRFEHEDYSDIDVEVGRQTSVSVALRPDVVTGRVTDPRGDPIAGATVAVAGAITHTEDDGRFRLAGVPQSGTLVVKAPGYRATRMPLEVGSSLDVTLDPISVRAIYINAAVVANPEALAERLAIVDRTELNAVVVDLKDSTGRVFYDSQVPLAREIGAVLPIIEPRSLVEELHRRGIYAIARIVVFEDPILAEAKPEWAIKNEATGDLWRTWNGLAWVNAHRPEVWDYNIALALEAASFGFDEIQLDYIRFPSDGPLGEAEYGVEHNRVTRTQAVGDFLARAHAALAPTPAYLGADIFGLTLWELGDSGIGQVLEVVAEHVDYICPMIYPSHFYPGSMGFDIPNDHPYEVILWSLQNGMERIPQHTRKLRPWLQDFSYGPGIAYGPDEVRAQIRAVEDAGLDSWMLWNADNVYHEEALRPG